MKRPLKIRLGGVSGFFRACQIACLICLVLVIGCFIVGQVMLSRPCPEFTTTPLSLREFYNRSGHDGELPAAATNLFYAHSSRGFTGFVELYRFDAPAEDCIAYGKRLLQQNDASQTAGLIPLKSSPEPINNKGTFDAMGLAEIDWFNVETVRSGFEGHQVRSGWPNAVFWIDADRGRFYFYASD